MGPTIYLHVDLTPSVAAAGFGIYPDGLLWVFVGTSALCGIERIKTQLRIGGLENGDQKLHRVVGRWESGWPLRTCSTCEISVGRLALGLVSTAPAKGSDPIVQTPDVGLNCCWVGNPRVHGSGFVVDKARTVGHFGFHHLYVRIRDVGKDS